MGKLPTRASRSVPGFHRGRVHSDIVNSGRAWLARIFGGGLSDFRGKDRLLRLLLPPGQGTGRDFDVPYLLGRYLGNTREFIDWNVWVYGGYEVPVLALLRQAASGVPGAIFVDVGAHAGTFTLALRDLVEHVHAVEPATVSRSRLERNLVANDAGNVTVHAVAMAEAPGAAALYAPDTHCNLGVASLEPAHNPVNRRRETVRLETLDRLLADVPVDRPLIVKIDVEGAARRVLAGFESLSHRPCLLVVETSSAALLDCLQAAGFEGRSLRTWYRRLDVLPLSADSDMHVLTNTPVFGQPWQAPVTAAPRRFAGLIGRAHAPGH